ncbi:hypothetical protein ACH429_12575 [Streptomyces pathocidini]|uniref:Uncharacterized protein n=1 Tax=Streptomyces pathocidini TaxID=1650571 RepID=A0ABW7UQM7_9ACTN|nr:hypothetical protein [Streptomyces pathocidini]
MSTRHHHAYVWLGHGSVLTKPGDAHRRPGHAEFRSAQVMPLECADWLLKPVDRILGTFHVPDEGADWYASQLAVHAGLFVGTCAPSPDREDHLRALAAGEDIVGGWWVGGERFLSVNLVACSPHRVRTQYVCPRLSHDHQ